MFSIWVFMGWKITEHYILCDGRTLLNFPKTRYASVNILTSVLEKCAITKYVNKK